MYSMVSFALALCDTTVFQKSPSSKISYSHHRPSPGTETRAEAEAEGDVVAEMRSAGGWLVAGGVLYMGSWGLVLGIPGRIGICGFALVTIGAILVTGSFPDGGLLKDTSSNSVATSGDDTCTWKEQVETARSSKRSSKGEDILVADALCCWWNAWMLRGYFTMVYFYAGVAKLEFDWLDGWTAREVLRVWTGICFIEYML